LRVGVADDGDTVVCREALQEDAKRLLDVGHLVRRVHRAAAVDDKSEVERRDLLRPRGLRLHPDLHPHFGLTRRHLPVTGAHVEPYRPVHRLRELLLVVVEVLGDAQIIFLNDATGLDHRAAVRFRRIRRGAGASCEDGCASQRNEENRSPPKGERRLHG
jgi:hypothetical protein